MLSDVLDAGNDVDGVAVALVGHDGHGHRVHGAAGGAYQHHGGVVLLGLVADVAILLDEGVHVVPVVNCLEVQELRRLAQTEHTHALVLVGNVGDDELRADKRIRGVDHHALAVVSHDAVLLVRADALAHEALLVHTGDDGHVGHCAVGGDAAEQALEGDVVENAVRVYGQRVYRGGLAVPHRHQIVIDDAYDLIDHPRLALGVVLYSLSLHVQIALVGHVLPLVVLPHGRKQHLRAQDTGTRDQRRYFFYFSVYKAHTTSPHAVLPHSGEPGVSAVLRGAPDEQDRPLCAGLMLSSPASNQVPVHARIHEEHRGQGLVREEVHSQDLAQVLQEAGVLAEIRLRVHAYDLVLESLVHVEQEEKNHHEGDVRGALDYVPETVYVWVDVRESSLYAV